MTGGPAVPRRTVLKGAAITAIAGTAALPAASAAPPVGAVRFIIDPRLPEAPALTARAAQSEGLIADPRGEMIALLLADGARMLARGGHIFALTGYADFALAQDLLRGVGRPIGHALAIDAAGRRSIVPARTSHPARTLSALLGPVDPSTSHRATSFAWMA